MVGEAWDCFNVVSMFIKTQHFLTLIFSFPDQGSQSIRTSHLVTHDSGSKLIRLVWQYGKKYESTSLHAQAKDSKQSELPHGFPISSAILTL